jgi:uroporphyrinogen decarboxylase
MTDRERFDNQMHYRPVDRCFNMEFGYWNENFRLWDLFADNGIRNNEEADQFFSFDDIQKIGSCIWMNPTFEERVVDETETSRILVNGDGLLAEVPKDDHDTIPHYIKATIETPEDWKICKEERFRLDDPARVIDVELLK